MNRAGRIAAIVVAILALALLLVALFPWGLLRGVVADRLTKRFGRPVAIGSIARIDTIGFTPTIAVRDVRIPQADWAGTGDFLRLAEARVTFPVWPLLTGTFRPRDIRVTGLSLALVRAKDGRTNWSRPGAAESGGASTDLRGLTVTNATIRYRDAKRDRAATVAFVSDARGLSAHGTGTIRGTPVRLAIAGASVAMARPGPWPFTARIDGPALRMAARGTMDRPLDTDRMTIDLTTRAADLKLVDAVIEAGLFGTQPVALAAHVRHDAPDWTITDLKGTIGRSDIAGRLTVLKRDGRTKLDGAVASHRFDFDDLASDAGRAAARADAARIGPRVVPDTPISLANMDSTDGTIAVRIARVVSGGGDTGVTALAGTLALDHQRLVVAPLAIRLAGGRAAGRAIVDQRGGAAHPTLRLDLAMIGSRLELLAGQGDVAGRIRARARLTGRGDTIRAAIGRADGRIGLVVQDGALPARYAAALGFDAGRALTTDDADRARLRCVVLGLAVAQGRGTVRPLVVDTSLSAMRGTGSIVFPAETIAIRLTGAPKRHSLLRLPGDATLSGTLSAPRLVVPKETKSVGNIFKAIGRAITGHQGPLATDADCGALAGQALR
ncbi:MULTISPECIES: AsmA family protein [unclassified Sphingomonas]|jgi:AsmA family protein|uniref:AsmA family protein n=1 Tax=unclassified Sphingomonas TaxID=196159 RepID=UPI000E1043EA|nr:MULTISPECIES: AsmA family protein [unclassified Sphingomonas]AXJ95235.1 asmA family protein [Sphingomonas sp. FARSPH]